MVSHIAPPNQADPLADIRLNGRTCIQTHHDTISHHRFCPESIKTPPTSSGHSSYFQPTSCPTPDGLCHVVFSFGHQARHSSRQHQVKQQHRWTPRPFESSLFLFLRLTPSSLRFQENNVATRILVDTKTDVSPGGHGRTACRSKCDAYLSPCERLAEVLLFPMPHSKSNSDHLDRLWMSSTKELL